MAVRIRLKRTGRRHVPSYRIVAMDARAKRDGRELEVLGVFNPDAREPAKQVVLKRDRIQHWLGVGAQPSRTVASLLKKAEAAAP